MKQDGAGEAPSGLWGKDHRLYFLRALLKRARTLRWPSRLSLIVESLPAPPVISLEAMQSATSAGDWEPSSKAVRHKAPYAQNLYAAGT